MGMGADFPITTYRSTEVFPELTSHGNNYLVIWGEFGNKATSGSNILGVFVGPSGVIGILFHF